jgi:hypothetical protein
MADIVRPDRHDFLKLSAAGNHASNHVRFFARRSRAHRSVHAAKSVMSASELVGCFYHLIILTNGLACGADFDGGETRGAEGGSL